MPIPETLIRKQKIAQNALSGLAGRTVTQAVPDLSKLSQQEAGGVLRTVTAGTLGTFGQASTVLGRDAYADYSAWAVESKIAKDTYKPTLLTGLASAISESSNAIVGYSMVKFQQGMFEDAATALTAGIMREVGNLYRDTVGLNSKRDDRVEYYQRVASANSCAFCLYMATQVPVSFESDPGYHDHCGCSTVPVFKGDEQYIADYYEEFDGEVFNARKDIIADYRAKRDLAPDLRTRNFYRKFPETAVNTENILARIRASTGRA